MLPALAVAALTTAATLGYDSYQKGKERKRQKRRSARQQQVAQPQIPGGTVQQSGQITQPEGNAFTGYNAYNTQLPQLSPEQIQATNALLPGTVQRLQGNEFDFAPIEQQSRNQFQKYTVPSLAARFSALGGINTDAYQNAMGAAHGEHETGLAALKSQYGLQQQTQQQNLFGTLMRPTYENIYTPSTQGFLGNVASGIAPELASQGIQAIGSAASNYFSQPSAGTSANPSAISSPDQTKKVLDYLNSSAGQQKYTANQRQQIAGYANKLGGTGANVGPSFGQQALGVGAGAVGGIAAGKLISYLLGK